MVDYYPFLLRAVQAANPADEQSRRAVYDRARQALADRLRARRPPASIDEIRAHHSGLEAAIVRIERGYSKAAAAVAPRRAAQGQGQGPAVEIAGDPQFQMPLLTRSRSRRGLWLAAAAVVVAAIGAGGYAAWMTLAHKPRPTASSIEAALREPLLRRKPIVATSTADLAPGIDGGSTDADLPLIFRRQRVFYRTTLPTGTIVVDKLQHFMYLVLPNSAALRYGIGVGTPCAELVGPRRVSRKAEWPEWLPPPESGKAGPLPGGPGNPMGARLLDLDDGASRIHGTNAPKTIGEDVELGCVRLVNDDVADLYNRVPLGTRVVMR